MLILSSVMVPTLNESVNSVKIVTPKIMSLIIRIFVSVAIFLIGFVIGLFLSKITKKILSDIELNKIMDKAFNVKIDLEQIIVKSLEYFIYFVTLLIGLNYLGISSFILNIVFISIIIVIVVSLLIAFEGVLPNMIAGINLKKSNSFEKGDVLIFNNMKGEIIDFDMSDVKIRNEFGEIVFIPNRTLASSLFKVIKKNSKNHEHREENHKEIRQADKKTNELIDKQTNNE